MFWVAFCFNVQSDVLACEIEKGGRWRGGGGAEVATTLNCGAKMAETHSCSEEILTCTAWEAEKCSWIKSCLPHLLVELSVLAVHRDDAM